MPIIANKKVMHPKTANGHMKTFHTYIISKSLSSESKHSVLKGGIKLTKKYITSHFLLTGPLWWYLIHLDRCHSLEHICGNVYMGVILYKIRARIFFFKIEKSF